MMSHSASKHRQKVRERGERREKEREGSGRADQLQLRMRKGGSGGIRGVRCMRVRVEGGVPLPHPTSHAKGTGTPSYFSHVRASAPPPSVSPRE